MSVSIRLMDIMCLTQSIYLVNTSHLCYYSISHTHTLTHTLTHLGWCVWCGVQGRGRRQQCIHDSWQPTPWNCHSEQAGECDDTRLTSQLSRTITTHTTQTDTQTTFRLEIDRNSASAPKKRSFHSGEGTLLIVGRLSGKSMSPSALYYYYYRCRD